jgi:DNA ligase-4
MTVRLPKKRVVALQFQPADVSSVTQVSKMFDSLEFCIVNGPASHSKSDLEKSIVEHGGSFVQSPGQETFCVVAARVTARVKNIISAGVYDVVKADWLIHCLELGHHLQFLPSHMLHTSPKTAAQFADDFDAYGDSYTDDVDETELKKIFDLMDSTGEISDVNQVTCHELIDLEEKYFPGPSRQCIFRQLKFYVDRFVILNDPTSVIHNCPLDLISLDIQCHGGIVCNTLDEDVSHVICHSSDLSRLPMLRQRNHERTAKFHCVFDGWVKECVEHGALRSERTFQVV